jgi:DNA-directed RNA polymerase specialized sigma24 family protein
VIHEPNEQQEEQDMSQRLKEWAEVEDLVMLYQRQFPKETFEPTTEDIEKSKTAATELLKRFSPLFKKYLLLFKNGQIDFNDTEMKLFVCSFIEDPRLQRALRRKKQKSEYRADIYKRFNFVKETYGVLPDDEINMDLQMLFLTIAKRYKQMGKSFCGYVYNSYRHEVSRHIKKFTRNPINITYKNLEFEDCINGEEDTGIEQSYEDNYYEDSTGLPDLMWVQGQNCSDIFTNLSPIDRKILVKYYLEEWNDRQIAEAFGIHINTVNQKRRSAVAVVASNIGINLDDVKRNRRSGKKAVLPTSQGE